MIAVADPGLHTTVQDLGRWGHQHLGVAVAGPMDGPSMRLANRLVGNSENAAALEVTLLGPALTFGVEALVAVAGAAFDLRLDGRVIDGQRPQSVSAGQTLSFGARRRGARAYLAVRGGIDVPVVLGSRATHVRTAMGGLEGRSLRAGDRLPVGRSSPVARLPSTWRPGVTPLPAGGARVRVLPGPDLDAFGDRRGAFWDRRYHVGGASDRMGYRLEGTAVEIVRGSERLSTAVTFGTIQVPPDGRPIILMADRQTAGGYPRLGTVITADLPVLGQLAPGDWVELVPCDRAAARHALARVERHLPAERHPNDE